LPREAIHDLHQVGLGNIETLSDLADRPRRLCDGAGLSCRHVVFGTQFVVAIHGRPLMGPFVVNYEAQLR
jgi:hypothetical protein